jgi:hypothetical protein
MGQLLINSGTLMQTDKYTDRYTQFVLLNFIRAYFKILGLDTELTKKWWASADGTLYDADSLFSTNKVLEKDTKFLITPQVMSTGKTFFQCQSFLGMPLAIAE